MSDSRRWTILAVGTAAQAATCCFLYGIPMLVPALRAAGLSLFAASLVVSAPMAGLLVTLIAWGAAADRHGERVVIATGVGIAAGLLALAAVVPSVWALGLLLALAGAFGASVNAASGRVVMGWFPPSERGLAMGARQTAQPLGVALAALALPPLAHAHGAHVALLFPALLCLVAAAAVVALVADPPRPQRVPGAAPVGSPYRGSRQLARIHLASSMLVVPQFAVATFTLVYLVGQRHWDPAVAGRLIFGFQAAGAAGRVVSGVWSDRVRSRLRPMRQLAVASATLMLVIALGAATGLWFVIAGFGLGALITVADNGLAYTAVAELAGPEWAGRALGVQNTVQNVAAVATAPVLAAVIGEGRYALGFALVAVFPLLAVPLTPVRAERRAVVQDVARLDSVR
ncbi:MAG TPA: MFS transporter [Jatrophihabitans sp.]|uniref:MFS transporter n=1 Tax=Jatrophihabitans sp. TaxID=1932789 RepID=UPI002E0CF404|nr:MFS transporter [Jatrophihabitans sp.]